MKITISKKQWNSLSKQAQWRPATQDKARQMQKVMPVPQGQQQQQKQMATPTAKPEELVAKQKQAEAMVISSLTNPQALQFTVSNMIFAPFTQYKIPVSQENLKNIKAAIAEFSNKIKTIVPPTAG